MGNGKGIMQKKKHEHPVLKCKTVNLSSNLKHHVQLRFLKLSITQALAKLHTFERAFDINLTQMITKKTELQPGYISIGLTIPVKLFQPHGGYWGY